MPVIQGRVSVAANSTVENILTGSQFEFLPYDAALEFGLTGVQGTPATGLLIADVYSGQDVLMENGAVAVLPTPGRTPQYPDDFQLTDVAAAGERLKIRVRNVDPLASIVNFSIRITPI